MRRTSRTHLLLAAGIASLVVAAGCSGGAKRAGGTSSTTTTVDVVTTVTTKGEAHEIFADDPAKGLDPEVTRRNGAPAGTTAYDVSFTANDDERIPATVMLPANATSPHPCVIVQHGLNGDRAQVVPFQQALVSAGAGAIAIDARLHGPRGTEQQRVDALQRPETMRDLFVQSVRDERRTLDYLATLPQCDPERTGYLGFSFGAVVGALLSGTDARVHGAALVSGGGDWDLLLGGSSLPVFARYKDPVARAEAVRVLGDIDPVRWVGYVSPRSVSFANGTHDDVVVPASARALQDAAHDPKTIVWYEGGHAPAGLELAKVFTALVQWYRESFG